MNTVINVSIILVVVIMQLDNLFVCYKVTDLIQNENPDLYKHYKGPYSLFKKFSGIQRLNALSPQHNNNWPFSPDIALCVSLTPERQMHYSFKIYHLHIHANVRAF